MSSTLHRFLLRGWRPPCNAEQVVHPGVAGPAVILIRKVGD